MFPIHSNLTTIGPQPWPCGTPPWLAQSPIKWKPILNKNNNNSTSHDGFVKFFVEPQRYDIEFVLFANGTLYPIALAKSPQPLTFANSDQPNHVHISIASPTSDAMRISWEAKNFDANARVKLGTVSRIYTKSIVATTPTTYSRSDLCGPPATTHGFYTPPYFYSAIISSLTPGRTYYYVVGSESSGYTREFSFVGPQAPSSESTLHITAIADMGETYKDGAQYHWMEPYAINTTNGVIHAWDTPDTVPLTMNPAPDHQGKIAMGHSGKEGPPSGHTLQWMMQQQQQSMMRSQTQKTARADVVVHVGDLSYATGYESEWDRFMQQIEPVAGHIPYMIGQGNHERDYPNSGSSFMDNGDSGGECGIPTQARFRMPYPASSSSHSKNPDDDGWYSWNQGPVHFLMMNSEMTAAKGTRQHNFLRHDLDSVNRTLTPWIIVMGHRPMYSSSQNATGIAIVNGLWIPDVEDLLLQHKVDLCLWGHVHNAEQTCPIYRGKCVDKGPVHAVIGNAGQALVEFSNKTRAPDWSVWRIAEFGYSTIEVNGSKNLTMKFWADSDHSLMNEFTIQGQLRRSSADQTITLQQV